MTKKERGGSDTSLLGLPLVVGPWDVLCMSLVTTLQKEAEVRRDIKVQSSYDT